MAADTDESKIRKLARSLPKNPESGIGLVRVLVIDDHSIFREGLKQVLSETPDIQVRGEAPNGRDGLSLVADEDWDVVVMDISMPEGDGLDSLAQLRSIRPNLPVLILSMYPEDQFALRALRAGASGYLCKDAAPDDLVAAIRKVASGGTFITPCTAERLAAQLGAGPAGRPHDALSDREFQVLRLIASGKTVSEIAASLALSVKTISTYRTRLLEKMHLKTNAELTRYALENNLVD